MIKVGCCGFPVAQSKYFQTFSTIEVQQSFYRTLGEKQVKNWRQKAPTAFEFILKAPQCITHLPSSPTYRRSDLPMEKRKQCGGFRLNAVTEEVMEVFFARAHILKAHKFLFQTPPSFKPTEKNTKAMLLFFKHFQKQGIFIWEPRGKDWQPEIIKSVCQQAGLIHAVDPFLYGKPVWGEFTYFRLHGKLRTYQYSYSDAELYHLLEMTGPSGYIMFNNSDMYNNALKLKEILLRQAELRNELF